MCEQCGTHANGKLPGGGLLVHTDGLIYGIN